MTDRKELIEVLEHCMKDDCNGCPNHYTDGRMACDDYIYGMSASMPVARIQDAVDLLKEQRAHIMTIDQLEDALDTVVWLETPVSENLADGYSLIMAYSHKRGWMLFDSPFGDNQSQDRLEYSEYGKSWRCWNKRPTDEQRQAVEWDA